MSEKKEEQKKRTPHYEPDSKIVSTIQKGYDLYRPDRKIISTLKEAVGEKKEKSETDSRK